MSYKLERKKYRICAALVNMIYNDFFRMHIYASCGIVACALELKFSVNFSSVYWKLFVLDYLKLLELEIVIGF